MREASLWSEHDQSARLAELTADTTDPAKELPLRRDVRSLGTLLGRVLVEQEGEAFFEVVERLRRVLIQHRDQPSAGAAPHVFEAGLMAEARELISTLSIDDAYRITKAFAIYFELTNLAETKHRKRRRRATRLREGRAPIEGSFRGTLFRMHAAGVPLARVLEALGTIRVTPVFTAHPTEITRHTIRAMRRRLRGMVWRVISVGCAVKTGVTRMVPSASSTRGSGTPAACMRNSVPRNEPSMGARPSRRRVARRRRLRWFVSARLVSSK